MGSPFRERNGVPPSDLRVYEPAALRPYGPGRDDGGGILVVRIEILHPPPRAPEPITRRPYHTVSG